MRSANNYQNSSSVVNQYFEPDISSPALAHQNTSIAREDSSSENDNKKPNSGAEIRKRKFSNYTHRQPFGSAHNYGHDTYQKIFNNRSKLINNRNLYSSTVNPVNYSRSRKGLFHENGINQPIQQNDGKLISSARQQPNSSNQSNSTTNSSYNNKNTSSNFNRICHKLWNNFKHSVDQYFETQDESDTQKQSTLEGPYVKRQKDNNSKPKESIGNLALGFFKKASKPVAAFNGHSSGYGNKSNGKRGDGKVPELSVEKNNYNFADFDKDFEANEKKSYKLNRELFLNNGLFQDKIQTDDNDNHISKNKLYGSSILRKKKFGNRSKTRSLLFDEQSQHLNSSPFANNSEYSFNPVLPLSMNNSNFSLLSGYNNGFSRLSIDTANNGSYLTLPKGSNDTGANDDDLMITKIRAIKQPISRKLLGIPSKYSVEDEFSPLIFLTPKFREYKKIIEQKKRLQEKIYKLREKKEVLVKPLSDGELATVQTIWKTYNRSKIITTLSNIDISVEDLYTLKDRQWLNDNIMDSYLSMVVARSRNHPKLPSCFVFTTHFYSTLSRSGYNGVRRWAKRQKINVTELDYVFIPINVMNSHWSLAVINNKQKKFQYFDSLSGRGDHILPHLQHYMTQEFKRLYPSKPVNEYGDYEFVGKDKFPQQLNGSDCGVFACTGVNFLSREKRLNFSQNDMPIIRRRMVYEIATNTLLD